MDLVGIKYIEEKLDKKLPQTYVDVVTNYPKELLATDSKDFGLLDDPELIARENLNVRNVGFYGEKWPERYFIIGLNGSGDYFVTTFESNNFSVGFADHETMECNPYADNLAEFIDKYVDETEM